ncbi:DUF177 domain-containing protein [Chloroflexota bacterium]
MGNLLEADMIVDVSQQLKQRIGSTCRCSINETSNSPEGDEFSVHGEVSLLRTDRGILLTGILNTRIRAVCSRCLGDFDQHLMLELDEEFLPAVDLSIGTDLSWSGEDGSFTIDENQEIDLGEVVRQCTLLALPMKPLCQEGCAGLCVSCGRKLNLGACGCHGVVDPTFPELASLVLGEERMA